MPCVNCCLPGQGAFGGSLITRRCFRFPLRSGTWLAREGSLIRTAVGCQVVVDIAVDAGMGLSSRTGLAALLADWRGLTRSMSEGGRHTSPHREGNSVDDEKAKVEVPFYQPLTGCSSQKNGQERGDTPEYGELPDGSSV